jgi:hypothetical protein
MSSSLTSLLGPMPHYKTLAYHVWVAAAIALRLNQVTTLAAARTVYYFSTSGSNSNNGLSPAAPKQTIAAALALHDASNGNIELSFKRGDTWTENVSLIISKPNCGVTTWTSITSASTSPLPSYATFSQFVTGYTWAKTAGKTSVYEAAETATVFWAQEDTDVTQPYTQVTSTTACDSTVGSWYADGTKIYVHTRDGAAPGSGTLGVCKWSNHGVKFVGSCDGGLCRGIQFLGYADTTNNWIAMRDEAATTNLVVWDRCASFFSYRHNAVTTGATAGGFHLFNRCRFGGLMQTDGTLFVTNPALGGGECIVNDLEAVTGFLPQTGVTNQISVCYGHTSGDPYKLGTYIIRGVRVRGGTYACIQANDANDLPDSVGNPLACSYHEIGTTSELNSLTRWDLAKGDGVRANCNVIIKPPAGRAEISGIPTISNGFVVNESVAIDLSVTDQSFLTFWDNGGTPQTFLHEYCQWHTFNRQTVTQYLFFNNQPYSSSGYNTNTIRNSIFSNDPISPVPSYYIAFGPTATYDNNAYSYITNVLVGNPEWGFGQDATPIYPTTNPVRQDSPSSGLPYAANTVNETVKLEYDLFLHRRPSTPTIGPVEQSPLLNPPSNRLRRRQYAA